MLTEGARIYQDSNQFVVPPSGGSFKVAGHINKGAVVLGRHEF